MTRPSKVLTVLVVLVLGLWGCARGPSNRAGDAENVRTLKNENARLELDRNKAEAARNQEREKVAKLEEKNAELQKDLDAAKGTLDDREQIRRQLQKAQ